VTIPFWLETEIGDVIKIVGPESAIATVRIELLTKSTIRPIKNLFICSAYAIEEKYLYGEYTNSSARI